jgi:hypothetical protein
VAKEQVKSAPNIGQRGEELSQADESALYRHYELNYTPPNTESGPMRGGQRAAGRSASRFDLMLPASSDAARQAAPALGERLWVDAVSVARSGRVIRPTSRCQRS